MPSTLEYIDAGGPAVTIGDVTIDSLPLNHPDGCLSYRLRRGNRTIVYATDHEQSASNSTVALAKSSAGLFR